MNKLAINLGPLKKGGGQNVALNFIQQLIVEDNKNYEFFFIVCESSALLKELENTRWANSLFIVSSNPIKRTCQELTRVRKFLKNNGIKVVYSYFGFAFLGSKYTQVIGSADSNLYFPDVDFWSGEGRLAKIKRYLVDKYRVLGIKNAAGVIYENEAMYQRATELFGVKRKSLIFPSINIVNKAKSCSLIKAEDTIRLLLLCGWQRNKNVLLIPKLANELKKRGLRVEFVITVSPDGSDCSNEFMDEMNKWQVSDSVKLIGSVDKSQLGDLYQKTNYVVLLSLLESFSNNIIEAWHFNKPLIISNELWSKAICKNAAFYVNRNDVVEIANGIIELEGDKARAQQLIDAGTRELKSYPSTAQRMKQELAFIESFF